VLGEQLDRVHLVRFNAAGTLLVSAGSDGRVCLWDTRDGTLVRAIDAGSGRLWSAALNPVASLLATAGDDDAVKLWDPRTGKHVRTLYGHERRGWAGGLSPEGTHPPARGGDGHRGPLRAGAGGVPI